MYQILNDSITGTPSGIKRLADNAFIPFAVDNTDFAQFKIDLSEGAELQNADGVAMTQAEALWSFLLTLP